ncbi:MAG: hypothetical protein R3195_18530 [Gemmatimonadota bacterium]|nr:hypothetical protein [Gemmatimonadota bacterium]
MSARGLTLATALLTTLSAGMSRPASAQEAPCRVFGLVYDELGVDPPSPPGG